MSEILFRGKFGNEWKYGYLSVEPKGLVIKEPYNDNKSEIWHIAPETVCQFTGITDKNGRKIFEGDILRCVDEYETYITSVYYAENTLCVDIHIGVDIPECDNYTAIGFAESIWKNQCCEVEVIGNIYDSPELLEVQG